jgi:hypothetical protein
MGVHSQRCMTPLQTVLFTAIVATLLFVLVIAPTLTLYTLWPRRLYPHELYSVLDYVGAFPMTPAAIEAHGVKRRGVDVDAGIAALRACRHHPSSCMTALPSGDTRGLNDVIRHRGAQRDTFLPLMVDKVHYRSIASAFGEHRSTPLLFNTSDSRCGHLPPAASLPPEFVMKARQSAGCTLVVRDGIVVTHRTCNGGWPYARSVLSQVSPRALGALATDRFVGRRADDATLREVCASFSAQLFLFSLSEWGYGQLSPGIVIEPLMHGPGRGAAAAEDLKCYALHGTTRYVLHVADRFVAGGKHDTVYTREGRATGATVLGSTPTREAKHHVFRRHPTLLPELLRRCDAMAKGLDVVRVDYLLVRAGQESERPFELVLGELTPYPGGGSNGARQRTLHHELAEAPPRGRSPQAVAAAVGVAALAEVRRPWPEVGAPA